MSRNSEESSKKKSRSKNTDTPKKPSAHDNSAEEHNVILNNVANEVKLIVYYSKLDKDPPAYSDNFWKMEIITVGVITV